MWIFCFLKRNYAELIDKMLVFLFRDKSGKPVHDGLSFGFSFYIINEDPLFLDNNPDVVMPECHDIYLGIISAGFNGFTEFRHVRTYIP